jgi:hypothetical protein
MTDETKLLTRKTCLMNERVQNRQLVEIAAAPLRRSPALGRSIPISPIRRPVHPRGLLRRRRKVLQPREFVFDGLILDPSLANVPLTASYVGCSGSIRRQKCELVDRPMSWAAYAFKRIRRFKRPLQLESYFLALGTPLRPEICHQLLACLSWVERPPTVSAVGSPTE